jgi:fibronectin type 3 domain-containing protein
MKKYLFTLCLLPVLLAAFASTRVKGEDVIADDGDTGASITYLTLVWDRNPEPDIAGYKVYYGRVSGDYTQLVTVTNPRAKIGVRGGIKTYFAVTAYNTAGVESDLSEEVHWP